MVCGVGSRQRGGGERENMVVVTREMVVVVDVWLLLLEEWGGVIGALAGEGIVFQLVFCVFKTHLSFSWGTCTGPAQGAELGLFF
jgi:hypothetical protein